MVESTTFAALAPPSTSSAPTDSRSARTRLPMAADDPRHGTANGYTNLGCRCAPCRAANSDVKVPAAQSRRANGLPPGDRRHGTDNGFTNYGCRCDPCKAARSAWRRASRVRSTAGSGAR